MTLGPRLSVCLGEVSTDRRFDCKEKNEEITLTKSLLICVHVGNHTVSSSICE